MKFFLISFFFFILNMIILRIYAKREMFSGYQMLLVFIIISMIPIINIMAFIGFLIILLLNKYDNIDDFARALFFVKNKEDKDVDNFKGKGYR